MIMNVSSNFKLLVLLAVLAVNLRPCQSTSDESSAWSEYKRKFNKTYESPEEEALRRELFEVSLRRIELHNSDPKMTYKLGLNHMSDWTDEEFGQLLGLAYRPEELAQQAMGEPVPFVLDLLNSSEPVPDQVDWRGSWQNRVSGVQDQGKCGACWAFATTGILEGQQVVRGFAEKLVPLSEQQLIDCGSYEGCGSGSNMYVALTEIARWGGIMSDKDYTYFEAQGECLMEDQKFIMSTKGYARLAANDEEAMLKIVARYGPIAVGVAAGSWRLDAHGVLPASQCEGEVDHAVLIVGYGTEDGRDYWLIKNSWSTDFGENGYIKIERGTNACQVASAPVIAVF